MNNIFKIRNLKVTFNEQLALFVPELDIPKGKLIFLLGNSGCGKTTFLETLGLMSKYYDDKAQVIFCPNSEFLEYKELWEKENLLANVRKQYFSFMFQNTNLFPQFNIRENIALTQVVQDQDIEHALLKASSELENLGLLDKGNNHISELSGGEKQRVAFVRAVCTNSTVLFADEPTGNLGDMDARKVMVAISDYVKSSAGKITAIVVTHQIQLALDYADQIIVIQKNHLIANDNVFEPDQDGGRKEWSTFKDNLSKNEHVHLQEIMDKNNPIDFENYKINNAVIKSQHNPSHETGTNFDEHQKNTIFKEFFGPKSTEELSLKKKRNWLLVAILTFVFCAIGIAGGALDVLEDKMGDPFINWISIPLPFGVRENVMEVEKVFSNEEIKLKYNINAIGSFYRYPLNIDNPQKQGTFACFGRTLDRSDPIFDELKNPDNLIHGDLFKDEKDIGIVVTERFLRDFGYDKESSFIANSINVENKDININLPIRGIVKNLPGKSQFITTPYFYIKRCQEGLSSFSPKIENDIVFFCEGDKEKGMKLKTHIEKFIYSIDSLRINYSPDIYFDQYEDYQRPWKSGTYIRLSFLPNLSWNLRNRLADNFINSNDLSDLKFYRIPYYPGKDISSRNSNLYYPNYLSLHMSKLDNIFNLRKELVEKFQLEIDLAKVESLDNYKFVSKLTNTLSIFIIIICVASVCIFISYILYIQLYKNRTYLGLLKAFGVLPSLLRNIYIWRMFYSLILSTIISIIFAIILGYSKILRTLLSVAFPIDKDYTYFNMLTFSPILFIAVVFLIGYLSLIKASNYILKFSPGDLIYDRIEKSTK